MQLKTCLITAVLLTSPALAQVQLTPTPKKSPDKIEISINGKPYSTFYMTGDDVTKPYLWPVRAATGTYISRMWPMENVAEEEKEKKDHPHQRGIWFAHDSVNEIDFWNNEASYKEPPKRGKMVLKSVEVKNGQDQGSLTAVFDWTDRQGNVQLTETRVMTFYAEKDKRTIDFDIRLKSGSQGVVWGDGKDGAFGIRLRPVLDETGGTGKIVNADGLVGEKQLWGKPSDWCDYSGAIGDEKVGVAIFDHPGNPSHPVRWHARGYGLFAANPFGLTVFTGEKGLNSSIKVAPGMALHFRYRVVVHPGDVKTLDLPALYANFAAAP